MARVGVSSLKMHPYLSLSSPVPAQVTCELVSDIKGSENGTQIISSPAESGLRKVIVRGITAERKGFFSKLARSHPLWRVFCHGLPIVGLPDINIKEVNEERVAGKNSKLFGISAQLI